MELFIFYEMIWPTKSLPLAGSIFLVILMQLGTENSLPECAMAQKDVFDVVIIGSGFGGTIAATKLAGLGHKVLLLERGGFWVTPEALGKPPAPNPPEKPVLVDWAKQNGHLIQYWPRP